MSNPGQPTASNPGESPYDAMMAKLRDSAKAPNTNAALPAPEADPNDPPDAPDAVVPAEPSTIGEAIGKPAAPGGKPSKPPQNSFTSDVTAPGSDPSPALDGLPAPVVNTIRGVSAVGGAVRAVEVAAARIPLETAGAGLDAALSIKDWLTGSTPEAYPGQKSVAAAMLANGAGLSARSWADTLSAKDFLGKVGNSSINEGLTQMGSLIAGADGVDALKIFAWAGKFKNTLNFATAATILQDPNSQRLSYALKGLGVDTEFTNWLGADPHDAPEWENRLKNGLENTLVGGAFDMTFQGLKYFRSVLVGAPDVAAKEAANRALKGLVPEGALPVEVTVTALPSSYNVVVASRYEGKTYLGKVGDIHITADERNGLLKANGLPKDGVESGFAGPDGKFLTREQTAALGIPDDSAQLPRTGGNTEVKVNGETAASLPSAQYDGLLAEARKDQAGSPHADLGDEPFAGETGGDNPAGANSARPLPGIGTAEGVAPLLRSLAISLHDTPHVVRSDADLMTFAGEAAREVGASPEDMLAYAQHVAGRALDIDTAVTATRTLWRKIAGDVDAFADRGVDTLTIEDLPAVKASVHNAIAFSGSFQTIRSGLGRGLRSLGLPDAAAYAAKAGAEGGPLMDEGLSHAFKLDRPTPPLPETAQELKDWLSMWGDLKGDPAARQNFLRGIQTLPSQFMYLRTSFANNFTANALAGAPSIGMNVVGPAIIGILHTLEKTCGAFIAALNPLLKSFERAQLLAVGSNAARAYVQTIADVPDAFRFALQAVRSNRSIIGGGWSVDVGRMGPITAGMRRASGLGDGFISGYTLGNAINFWPRNFQRINAGLDEFAKRLSYMGEVRLNALVESSTGFKLDGTPLAGPGGAPFDKSIQDSYVRSAMENSIDEVGAATDEVALRSAERTTFTGSLSGNDYHPLVGKAAGIIQAVRSQFPEARYILPVFSVPANSVGETLRRIPVANFLLGETRDELLGNLGAVRQADAYGRTLLGGAFLMWAYHAARQGELTGAGPSDPQANELWKETHGFQPYSLKVNGQWVNYSRYDLPGSLLGIPATMFDASVYHPQDTDLEHRTFAAIGALAQYFKDKSALQGVSDLMDFGKNPQSDASGMERLLGNVTSRMLVPNFVTQLIRNGQDPTKRVKPTIGSYLLDALPRTPLTPGAPDLDPMRNVLGEPLYTPRDTLLENLAPLTISPLTTNRSDPVMAELDRLYQATGFAGGVTHHSAFDGGTFDSRSVRLEDGASLYDHLIRGRMTVVNPGDGATLRQALTTMFASDEYKAAKDADASNLVDSEGMVSRGAVVSKVFSAYNRAAIQSVAASSPIARRWLAIGVAKKTDDARLRPYRAQDLHDNPLLLKALGIDIKAYEDKVSGQ